MNIEGVNLSPLLPGNSSIEVAGVQSFSENGAIPEGFSNALIGQIELLKETIGQSELPVQLQNMTMPKTVNGGDDIGELLKHNDNREELVALIDKYLPLANEKSKAADLDENVVSEDVDLEATLLALTDSPKAVTSDDNTTVSAFISDEVTATQNLSLNRMLADSPKAITSDDNTPDSASTSDEMTTAQNLSLNCLLTDSLTAVTPDSNAINPDFTAAEMTTTDNMNLALTDLLKTVTPSIIPDQVAVAKNRTEVTALKGFYLATPHSEEAKLNEEHVVSGNFLQKETVVRQSIQDKQSFNLPYVENTAPAEKTQVLEKQASISGIEQATSGVASDITPFHKQMDSKIDSPAITRPLTHPSWGKDLGEQIVWMSNKAIPAAEIRLNPVHLGPISVRIDVNQDQATILFTAQHTEVREAIEASIPKLREMLGTQQLNLVNVNISQNSSSDQGRSQSQTFAKTPENREQGIESVAENEHDRVAVSKGLLSIYA